MLGCHEFCGYYEWTFHYSRRTWGPQSFDLLMAQAMGLDSQRHYLEAGQRDGIKGLHEAWFKTAGDEGGDWSIHVDPDQQVLRFDIHKCPSKGFLLTSDRMQDEDYCDHCMGWIGQAMSTLGFEVNLHEHNHCGQCHWQIEPAGHRTELRDYRGDVRDNPLWSGGYVERWERQVKLPVLPQQGSETDWCALIERWFAGADRLVMLGRGPSARDVRVNITAQDTVVVVDPTYATRDVYDGEPHAVLIGDDSRVLDQVAKRYLSTPPQRRPLLLYSYLPRNIWEKPGAFVALGLPRPVPLLPLLMRKGLYRHVPHEPYPTSGVFLALLAAALNKPAVVAGIDLYRHPSGQQYLSPQAPLPGVWPDKHSEACDVRHARLARRVAGDRLRFVGVIEEALAQESP